MATHGRKGLNHLMRGSVAEDVVNHIDCPIWTLAER
jgi:nucleotide-binding universal stress UspA family protein